MWSLGKVFRSPEVCRVYLGSFNAGRPINDACDLKPLLEKEQKDLLDDLYEIPARSADRKASGREGPEWPGEPGRRRFVRAAASLQLALLLRCPLRERLAVACFTPGAVVVGEER